MCGRYQFDITSEELRRYYDAAFQDANIPEEWIGLGEVYPTNYVVTIGGATALVPALTRWGFEGFKKGQHLINARSETVEEKKMFHRPFKEHRCVFPMSGFYEWNDSKQKMYATNPEEPILFVAGFYRIHKSDEGPIPESIILTTSANESLATVHHRMPVLLERNEVRKWITDLAFAREHLNRKMPSLNVQEAT